jgi:hypothetical protein
MLIKPRFTLKIIPMQIKFEMYRAIAKPSKASFAQD